MKFKELFLKFKELFLKFKLYSLKFKLKLSLAVKTIILYSEIDLLISKCVVQKFSLKFKNQYLNFKEWSLNSSRLIFKNQTFFFILHKKKLFKDHSWNFKLCTLNVKLFSLTVKCILWNLKIDLWISKNKVWIHFYTPVFRRDVLWYGDVRPSVRPSGSPSIRPSVRPSVRHSFPHFSPTCFDILIWNFVYHFIFMYVRSSSNAINFCHFLQELCSFLTSNSYKYAVFRTFLLHALTYRVQILYMTLF